MSFRPSALSGHRNVRPAFALGALLFLGSWLAYVANCRLIASHDSLATALTPFSLLAGDGMRLDRWVGPHGFSENLYCFMRGLDGRVRNAYPPGAALVVAPLYAPLRLYGELWNPADAYLVPALATVAEKYAAATVAAFAVLFLFDLLRRLTSIGFAAILAAIFGLATPMAAVASQSLFQHAPAALVLILALRLLLTERPAPAALAGLLAALLTAIRPTDSLFALALGAMALRRGWLVALPFGATALAGCVALFHFNVSAYGSVIGGYSQFDSYLRMYLREDALAGIFLSPRGILFFCPFLPLLGFGRKPAALLRSDVALSLTAWLGVALVHAFTFSWWGGENYGARFFVDGMPWLFVFGARALEDVKSTWRLLAWAATVAWSLALQAIGLLGFPHGESGYAADLGHFAPWSLTRSAPWQALRALPAPAELQPLSRFGRALPTPPGAMQARIELLSPLSRVQLVASRSVVRLRLTNRSPLRWSPSGGPSGETSVRLLSRWSHSKGDLSRLTAFPIAPLAPGASVEIEHEMIAPKEPGSYRWALFVTEGRLEAPRLLETPGPPDAGVEVVTPERLAELRRRWDGPPAVFLDDFEDSSSNRWNAAVEEPGDR
jgi:hypothetical protein